MPESKRAARRPWRGLRIERLSAVSLLVNAVLAFAAAPALFVLAVLFWLERFGRFETNEHLFLGAVSALLGVFLVLLSGLRVWEHVRARKRFRELLLGDRKSAVIQNLDELASLARALGPSYRRRLESRLAELGIKR